MINIKDKIDFLEKIQDSLWKQMEKCTLCPRKCKINRLKGKKGVCKAGKDMVIYAAFLHRGEEPPISGDNGSGAIFFSGCGLGCIYCQNYEFSHSIRGSIVSPEKLAEIMLKLQDEKAHNINLITATHMLPLITNALLIAFNKGLILPIVYNTSGYERIEIVKILDYIVDIYLTDIKYINPQTAIKLSNSADYPEVAKKAIIEMYRQRKYPHFNTNIMEKGLIVRHLVIPGYIEESKQIILWLKEHVPLSYISIMSQYKPYDKAYMYPETKRPLTKDEYTTIKDTINSSGIEKGWLQEFNPDYNLAGVHIQPKIPI